MSLKSTTNIMSHGSFTNRKSNLIIWLYATLKLRKSSTGKMSPEELCIHKLAEDVSYFDLPRPYLTESYY